MGTQVKSVRKFDELIETFQEMLRRRNPVQINNTLIYPIKKNK